MRHLLDFALSAAAGESGPPPYLGATPSIMVNRLDDERISLPRAFELVPTVYSCVSRIQDSIAGTPLLFSQNEKEAEPRKGNPAWLFSYGNAFDTGNDLMGQIVGSLLINGNGYVFLDYLGTKVPQELRCLPGNIVLPKSSDGLVPDRYVVTLADGKEWVIPAWQILHFRMYAPDNGMLGLSPLQVAMLVTRVSRNADRWIDNFYSSGGLVSGYFTNEDGLTQAEREKVQETMLAQRRAGKPVVLPRNIKYERTGLTQEEMQFLETSNWTNAQICMIYKVPPWIMGIKEGGSLSDAGAKVDLSLYLHLCRKPLGSKIASVINARLLDDRLHQGEFGFGWKCAFDYDRDPTQIAEFLEKAKGVKEACDRAVLAPNEGRDILEREPLDGEEHDELYEKPVAQPMGPTGDSPKPRKAISAAMTAKPEGPAPTSKTTAAVTVELRATRDARVSTQEKVMRAGVRKLYEARMKRVVAKLRRAATDHDVHASASVMRAAIDTDHLLEATTGDRTLIRKFMRRVLAGAAIQEIQDLGLRITFNLQHSETAKWLDDRAELVITGTTHSLSMVIRDSINEGMSAHETSAELIARVREVFGEHYANQANKIVRTETVSAYNKGAREAWRQSGVVQRKQWVTAGDELVRPGHVDADGQVVDLDDLFLVDGELLDVPGDHTHGASGGNTINCRCTAAPIVERGSNNEARRGTLLLDELLAQ